MTSRFSLETKAVATLRKVLPLGRKGSLALNTARARFYKEMDQIGLGTKDAIAYQAWCDCIDMAHLENAAQ